MTAHIIWPDTEKESRMQAVFLQDSQQPWNTVPGTSKSIDVDTKSYDYFFFSQS
jgi:hypothetical protein